MELRPSTEEIHYEPNNGCCMLLVIFGLFLLAVLCAIILPIIGLVFMLAIGIPLFIISFIFLFGLFTLQPNNAAVFTLCGKYKGSCRESGFYWCNPFYTKVYISLRSNNLNGEIIKVNDKVGNPILIAAVVVWKVKYTARAIFDVLDYNWFVTVQYESAVRNLAMNFAYETSQYEVSLRDGHSDVTNFLMKEMQSRLSKAGIEVEEAKITTLSYSPEIASVMLRRQQAEAVISAREKIVQGAISIIGHAITKLRDDGIADLNREERSKLVSNLLVVLCSESNVQPVLNTGS